MALEPTFPAGASIVQPASDDERAATQAFLTWVSAVLDWGRQGQARAELAKSACPR